MSAYASPPFRLAERLHIISIRKSVFRSLVDFAKASYRLRCCLMIKTATKSLDHLSTKKSRLYEISSDE